MTEPKVRALLERYPLLIADCERFKHLGWYPSGGEVYKFALQPTFEAVDRFADHVFGGIGFEMHDYMIGPAEFGIEGYGRHRPELSPETLASHHRLFVDRGTLESRAILGLNRDRLADWLRLIADDGTFGGIRVPMAIGPRHGVSTLHALRTARRAIVVSELMRARGRSVGTLVEIGGGHGRTLRDMIWTLDVETAFYVDLPLNMLLAARFLGHFFGDRLNLVWDEGDTVAEGKINIVAPWLIERIDLPVDLLVNFLSFQHMSVEALRFYGERLIEPRVAAIYYENRDRPREGFDSGAADYPFRSPFALAHSKEVTVSRGPDGQPLGIVVGELLLR